MVGQFHDLPIFVPVPTLAQLVHEIAKRVIRVVGIMLVNATQRLSDGRNGLSRRHHILARRA
jgi:hypothetical protein